MKIRTTALAALATASLIGCTTKEVRYIESAPAETTTEAPASTRAPTTTTARTRPTQPISSGYDPDEYDTMIWREANDFWWLFSTDDLLSMGLAICEEFDRGQTIDQVTESLIEVLISTGTTDLMEGTAAMTASALFYLCPEHRWWLDTI